MTMTAQGLADAITSAQGTAENTEIQAATNLSLATGIINYLTANALITVTIGANTISTPGNIGPTGPVQATGSIS